MQCNTVQNNATQYNASWSAIFSIGLHWFALYCVVLRCVILHNVRQCNVWPVGALCCDKLGISPLPACLLSLTCCQLANRQHHRDHLTHKIRKPYDEWGCKMAPHYPPSPISSYSSSSFSNTVHTALQHHQLVHCQSPRSLMFYIFCISTLYFTASHCILLYFPGCIVVHYTLDWVFSSPLYLPPITIHSQAVQCPVSTWWCGINAPGRFALSWWYVIWW